MKEKQVITSNAAPTKDSIKKPSIDELQMADNHSNSSTSLPKICKRCGKAFKSLKALCGHMASHSDKDKNPNSEDEDEEEEEDENNSWSSEDGEENSVKRVLFASEESDTETEDLVIKTIPENCKKKLLRKIRDQGSSSIITNDVENVKEKDEVAKFLMILSRDRSAFADDNNNKPAEDNADSGIKLLRRDESNKNNGAISDYSESSDSSCYFLHGGCDNNNGEEDSEANSLGGPRRGRKRFNGQLTSAKSDEESLMKEYNRAAVASYFAGIDSRKRKAAGPANRESEACDNSWENSKYKCFNCKKTFKSYQALGGHRPCHKRTNAYYESRFENLLEDSKGKGTAEKKENKGKATKSQLLAHACPYCDRVFKNGQALGGHKRSHFLGGNGNEGYNGNNSGRVKEDEVVVIEQSQPFDLNLPAPKEEEGGDDDEEDEEEEEEEELLG